MNFRKGLTALFLTLLLSVSGLAQNKTFKEIIGRNPNSSDLRARVSAAKHGLGGIIAANHKPLSPQMKQAITQDWAVSLGPNAGLLPDQYAGAYNNFKTPACTDWVMFPIPYAPAVGGQANAVVYTSLYRGTAALPGLCGTGNPVVQSAIALGSNPITDSPDIAYEGAAKGTKFSATEGANAMLHIVTVGSDTGTTTNAAKADCLSGHSCDVPLDFTNVTTTHCTPPTTHSATHTSGLFVDFSTDEGYIGDDAGKIYHITGAFNGTPTVDFCSGAYNGGAPIGEIVHVNIGGTDYVYFVSNGRSLFRVQVNTARTGFTGNTSLAVGGVVGTSFSDFLFDVDTNQIYAWTNHNNAGTSSTAALDQINATATPMTIESSLNLGADTTLPYYIGDFDNTFWTSGPTGSGATGYTCVNESTTGAPGLASYQFTSAGDISGFTTMTNNTNINPVTSTGNWCSPITTTYDSVAVVNALFVNSGNGASVSNGTRLSRFDITTPLTSNSTTPTNTYVGAIGGNSGIIEDFEDSGLGADTSNIYVGNLARPTTSRCGGTSPNFDWCAIKLQQSNLQ